MDKKKALDILIANACCTYSNSEMCEKCPWNHTEDCKNTNFSDVIYEAINTMLEDK